MADAASTTSNRYVLTSVLFASVLFLAGIASQLSERRLAHFIVGVAVLAFIGAFAMLLSVPMRV